MKKIITLIGLCMVFILVGCEEIKESYPNLDEAMEVKFNESIHEVNKCSLTIIHEEEYLNFAFFGRCGHIKRECRESDICKWYVATGARCDEKNECYTDYTGRCTCRFKDG